MNQLEPDFLAAVADAVVYLSKPAAANATLDRVSVQRSLPGTVGEPHTTPRTDAASVFRRRRPLNGALRARPRLAARPASLNDHLLQPPHSVPDCLNGQGEIIARDGGRWSQDRPLLNFAAVQDQVARMAYAHTRFVAIKDHRLV